MNDPAHTNVKPESRKQALPGIMPAMHPPRLPEYGIFLSYQRVLSQILDIGDATNRSFGG
jgi:hypothetical protein